MALKIFAIQTGNGGACLMAFHFDKAEALALAGKNIRHKLARAHRAKFGKQGLNIIFTGAGRQITNK